MRTAIAVALLLCVAVAPPLTRLVLARQDGNVPNDLRTPDEKHLRNVRQLTFGGENAEAYFSPDGTKLSYQAHEGSDKCDQQYVLDLVTATRRPRDFGLALENLVAFGASPRATLFLVRGAQGLALLDGRPYVLPEDVKRIAPDVLRHRIHVTYEAEAEGVDGEEVARRILEQVRVP